MDINDKVARVLNGKNVEVDGYDLMPVFYALLKKGITVVVNPKYYPTIYEISMKGKADEK